MKIQYWFYCDGKQLGDKQVTTLDLDKYKDFALRATKDLEDSDKIYAKSMIVFNFKVL